MKRLYKLSALILCLIMLFTLAACSNNKTTDTGFNNDSTDSDWETPGNVEDRDDQSWNEDITPDVTITEIDNDKNKGNPEMIEAAIKDESTYEMVNYSIEADLRMAGFEVGSGVAVSENPNGVNASGLYYYTDEWNLYEDQNYRACGFVEIATKDVPYVRPGDDEIICIYDNKDIESANQAGSTAETQENTIINVYAYDYEDINSGHFIYKDEYVQYYRDGVGRVVYERFENLKENYNLSIGSLYDYDNNRYIYDERIFDEYKPHGGVSVIDKEDYAVIKDELTKITEEQEKAGYQVQEYNIMYISSDAIQEYLDSQDNTETFFGYDVNDLTSMIGAGMALEYKDGQFHSAPVVKDTEGDNLKLWKETIKNIAIGTGIIIIGAALAPVTGGASFGCALLTAAKITVVSSIIPGLIDLAINTSQGIAKGKDVKTALKDAAPSSLNAFTKSFKIASITTSIGIASGAFKPNACFTAGTPVATANGFVAIEDIKVGDSVLSYNEVTKQVSYNKVQKLYKKAVGQTINLNVSNEVIETTFNHPFYLADSHQWIKAGNLKKGDKVLSSNGSSLVVVDKEVVNHSTPIDVYNMNVENDHSYFVGYEKILVHNNCAEFRKQYGGLKAQRLAVRNEIEKIYNGTAKFDYPTDLKEKITSCRSIAEAARKYAGEFRAHHIIPVETIQNQGLNPSLVSDQKNLVVLLKNEHEKLHGTYGYSNIKISEEYLSSVIKMRPYMGRQIHKLIKGVFG